MGKHVCRNLIRFKLWRIDRPQSQFSGQPEIAPLFVINQLGHPDQAVDNDEIFYNGWKSLRYSCSEITHSANVADLDKC